MREGLTCGRDKQTRADWMLPVPLVRWRLLAFTFLQLKVNLYAATGYITSQSVSFLLCMYNMHNTTTCAHNHTNRLGEVSIPSTCVTLGFWMIESKLGCVTQMLHVLIVWHWACHCLEGDNDSWGSRSQWKCGRWCETINPVCLA